MNTTSIHKIYCIAICGMGMGSLAGLLKGAGFEVSGSDSGVYPPMSDQLQSLGILVQEGYAKENVPPDADLVIIGNAVSKDHPEVLEVQRLGLPYLSMADALADFFLKEKTSIVVAGTHGKTTTASLLAWLLNASERDPSFLIGGVLKNFDRSWQLSPGDCFVVEGDEYDTAFFDKTPKFLHYRPRLAILNPIEFDHADIYADLNDVMAAFRKFVQSLPPEGRLFACSDSGNVRQLLDEARCPVTTFGKQEGCDYRLMKIAVSNAGTEIFFMDPSDTAQTLQSPLPGEHNALNLLGAFALLKSLDIDLSQIQRGLDCFEGIRRRQEVRGVVRDVTVIDDFAHHPTAVRLTLEALQHQYSGRKLWAVFEPRSNTSRTRVFQKEWAHALSLGDEVVLASPYDNGKIPQENLLDVDRVAAEICVAGGRAHHLDSVDKIIDYLVEKVRPSDVVVILSNGGFGGIHEKLLERLKEL